MDCQHKGSVERLFRANDYISGESFDVNRCADCHLVFTETGEDDDGLGEYYPADYYGKKSRYSPLLQALSNRLIARRARYLESSELRAGSLLDFGCGQGYFMKHFRDRDWTCVGTEASDAAAFHAREVLDLDVRTGDRAISALQSDSFDLVCLWHVLEHVADHDYVLSQIHRVLKADGKLLVGVPNFGSWEARIGREGWFHLDVPRHLLHFTEESLHRVMREAGFSIERRAFFVPEYDFFSLIQTVQNRLGFRQNLLYSLIKKGDEKSPVKDKPGLLEVAGVIVTFPILLALSLVCIPLAVLAGNGSSIVVVASRKDAE